jgi:hypothetical protein
VVVYLPSKHEALSSNPNTNDRERNTGREREREKERENNQVFIPHVNHSLSNQLSTIGESWYKLGKQCDTEQGS